MACDPPTFTFLLNPYDDLITELAQLAKRHQGGQLRVLSAWATEGGVDRLVDAIGDEILDVCAIVGISARATTVEGLLRILEAGWDLRLHFVNDYQLFHPKVYWFVGGAENSQLQSVGVGSGNLTEGGMAQNIEASLLVTGCVDSPVLSAAFTSVETWWDQFVTSPQSHHVGNPSDLEYFFMNGFIVSEPIRLSEQQKRPSIYSGRSSDAGAASLFIPLPTVTLEHSGPPLITRPLETPAFLKRHRQQADSGRDQRGGDSAVRAPLPQFVMSLSGGEAGGDSRDDARAAWPRSPRDPTGGSRSRSRLLGMAPWLYRRTGQDQHLATLDNSSSRWSLGKCRAAM